MGAIIIVFNVILTLTITITLATLSKMSFRPIGRKKLVQRIERQINGHNYFEAKSKFIGNDMIQELINDSGLNISVALFYLISITSGGIGGYIGYKFEFPMIMLILTITFSMIPIFLIYMVGAYKITQSYKTTFNVLHIAEKTSQLTNSPLTIYKKILPHLCKYDKVHFQKFVKEFQLNKQYIPLFNSLENSIRNKFFKELIIYGRETTNGIDYNQAIRLVLSGYRSTYELMAERKRKLGSFIIALYILCIGFFIFSIYIRHRFAIEIQDSITVQLLIQVTMITGIIGFILSSIALVNISRY